MAAAAGPRSVSAWVWLGAGAAVLTFVLALAVLQQGLVGAAVSGVWCGACVGLAAFWLTRPSRDTGRYRGAYGQPRTTLPGFFAQRPAPEANYARANPLAGGASA